jgi:hypothetical protein
VTPPYDPPNPEVPDTDIWNNPDNWPNPDEPEPALEPVPEPSDGVD